jgi:hypothetical protein
MGERFIMDIETAIASTNSRHKLRAGSLAVLAFCSSAVVTLAAAGSGAGIQAVTYDSAGLFT